MGVIPIQRLYRANVVVNDLRVMAQNYARILGITRWEVCRWTPARLRDRQLFGYRADFGYATATGSNPQGVTFRLVQPTHGFSTFTEFLITRGEGIHSLCASVLAPRQLESLVERLAEQSLPVAQAASGDEGAATLLLDTRRALGGYFLEVANPAAASLPPDEVWDLTGEDHRPEALNWITQIPKIGHFGVAVSSVIDKLPAYASLLGMERWSGVHFHSSPGGLEHATFDGQVVDNAWLLAITDVADFGVELLQGTREPTDYRRTVERIGEGIHHVLVKRGVSDAEWSALRDWMESMQIGVVMSGRVRSGSAEFFYLDTRSALGGYLLEALITRSVPEPTTDVPPGWRFDLDFTTRV